MNFSCTIVILVTTIQETKFSNIFDNDYVHKLADCSKSSFDIFSNKGTFSIYVINYKKQPKLNFKIFEELSKIPNTTFIHYKNNFTNADNDYQSSETIPKIIKFNLSSYLSHLLSILMIDEQTTRKIKNNILLCTANHVMEI